MSNQIEELEKRLNKQIEELEERLSAINEYIAEQNKCEQCKTLCGDGWPNKTECVICKIKICSKCKYECDPYLNNDKSFCSKICFGKRNKQI